MSIVYINTNQSREKQIFTAAHELGHIWKVEQYVRNACGLCMDHKYQEDIVNRFAAELLMPAMLCKRFIDRNLDKFPHQKGRIKALDLLRTIAAVMNEYFAPYKSVVRRYYELGVLPYLSAQSLYYGDKNLPLSIIQEFVRATAKEEGYSRLFQIDKRKWIEGLKELLDQDVCALVLHQARNCSFLWAGFPHGCVVVLDGRQPACVLRLALRKSRSKSILQFLAW